ncbi:hypothetical protein RCO48_17890 [Peribacillus frigoritolerans]|nr:hypothetical protein [Peribacillus frigoritolerans]
MKKLIIPTFCFAVLSTVAFERKKYLQLHYMPKQANIEDVMFVQVNSGSLNMRKTGAEGASIVAKLANGTQVTVYRNPKAGRRSKPMEKKDMSVPSIYRQRSQGL